MHTRAHAHTHTVQHHSGQAITFINVHVGLTLIGQQAALESCLTLMLKLRICTFTCVCSFVFPSDKIIAAPLLNGATTTVRRADT